MSDDQFIAVGVRHHSPACARLVKSVIETHRPAFVLIEGPSDFNPHIGELRLAHKPPLAIFSYCADELGARSSYAPFCAYSPEWLALQTAWRVGAEPLFCDLPAWRPDFGDHENRYADPSGLGRRYALAVEILEREFGAEGPDALWDALAEQREPNRLAPVLARYFDGVRPPGADDPAEAGRESFMARHVAWALRAAKGRKVVLVCGGWHVNGVRAALASADGERPATPRPEEGLRADSFLVPFSYGRLDRFHGYAAGMPSPAYYGEVFDKGLSTAADWAMARIAGALREARLPVSTADRIAWAASASALARMRGHSAPLRADVLDAALSTLVKDALPRSPAWTQRDRRDLRSEDVDAIMLRALSGEAEGELAPGARRPPLAADVERRLTEFDLSPGPSARKVSVDWREPAERPRARALHQLRLIGIPGFKRLRGPASADARDLSEDFEIARHPHFSGALIEAARWGGELPMAAAARLDADLRDRRADMASLSRALSDGLFAGLFGLTRTLFDDLAIGVSVAVELAPLGQAGRLLQRLYRYGDAFGDAATQALIPLCRALFERVLWLCEGPVSEKDALRALDAVLATRDLARDAEALGLDAAAASGTFSRVLANPDAPPALAGAALGYLIAMGDAGAGDAAVGARVRSFGAPARLGDFLAGLFALAREAMRASGEALDAVNALVAGWSDEEFLTALPALRAAFSWFPPREREALARFILERAGYSGVRAGAEAAAWMRQRASLGAQIGALEIETRVARRLAAYGLNGNF